MKIAEPNLTVADVNLQRSRDPEQKSRSSCLSSLWALYTLTLRQYLRGKRWLVVGLLFLLPVGMALLVRATAHQVPPITLEFILAQMFIPQALLPFAALLYASGMILDEQEDQTITYLLIRPISKPVLYVVKLLATLTTTLCLVALFTALTFAAIYVGAHGDDAFARCLKTVAIHSLAVIAYCSLFGLISLVTNRILVIGIVYAAVVEGILANLPFGIRLATVIYYARVMAYRTMQFVVPGRGGDSTDVAAEIWQFDTRLDPGLAEHPSTLTCITTLVVVSLICSLGGAWLCSRREFHVKTPEKA